MRGARFAAQPRRMANETAHNTKPCGVAEFPALLNTDQCAALLGISRRTVQELVEKRRLAAVKFGRNVRFDLSDVRAFVDRHRDKAAGWASRKLEGTGSARPPTGAKRISYC